MLQFIKSSVFNVSLAPSKYYLTLVNMNGKNWFLIEYFSSENQINGLRRLSSGVERPVKLTLVNEQHGIRNIKLNSPKNR